MALRFTPEAFNDLNDLDAYLSDKSPQGLCNVLAALKKTFQLIEGNAFLGRPTSRESVRVAIEPGYKYVIPYYDDGTDIWVLRVYHSRRAPLDYLALDIPL
jgi:plasmid stabilization system protein ParE